MKIFYILILFFAVSTCAWAEFVSVDLKPTHENSKVSGQVQLEETEKGLKVTAHIREAKPGLHGFHIHEHGSCEDQGNAAGSHYNPDNVPHGDLVSKKGFDSSHAGDLGNIQISDNGEGHYEVVVPQLSLSKEPYNVRGKSIIFHEKEDDFGQPTGNSGARLACGVIPK